ncbi:MAG: 50S ribosomal protein L4 [Candidatus Neomarinimicrobiota bacterium]
MQFQVYNSDGESTSRVRVHDSVFKIKPVEDVVYRAAVSEMTGKRRGTHATKNRAAVRGGGRKPWRQKGRGVARAGSNRSPLWRGGGVIFGPSPREHSYRLPKKMKRLARRSVLSQRAMDKEIYVVDKIEFKHPKTKSFVAVLSKMGLDEKKITFLPGEVNRNVLLSARNLPNVRVVPAAGASTYDLLDCDVLLFDKAGIKNLEGQLTTD